MCRLVAQRTNRKVCSFVLGCTKRYTFVGDKRERERGVGERGREFAHLLVNNNNLDYDQFRRVSAVVGVGVTVLDYT